jgi:hypothetical protein
MVIFPASSWGRKVNGNPARFNARAVDELTVHYTGAPRVMIGKGEVAGYLKRIERQHQGRNSSTIGYNFAIDKWGQIWELRGLTYRNAANGNVSSNKTTVSVLLLVGVNDNEPTPEMVGALQELYQLLSVLLGRPLHVRPHQYHKPTACPGPNVLALINAGIIQQAAPQPPAPEEKLVVVQSGDSWWRLAKTHLGSGLKWGKLKSYNNGVALHAGVTIKVPL